MDSVSILTGVLSNFKSVTDKPDKFLNVQIDKAEESKTILKKLYDFVKIEETLTWQPSDALPELIINDFDEEQIWQEIELQNEGLCNKLVQDVALLLAKKDKLAFDVGPKVNLTGEEDSDITDNEDEAEGDDDDDDDDDEKSLSNENGEEEAEDSAEESCNSEFEDGEQKLQFSSEVDDEFFKLCEMENFCEQVEKDEEKSRSSSTFDLFSNAGENSEEERELVRYNDFFGRPKKKNFKESYKVRQKKVKFAEQDFSEEEKEEKLDEHNNVEGEEVKDKHNKLTSSFESRQERLKSRIESLEEEALKEKPWFLKGEVMSSGRPQNSLLEEYVDFERAVRPAPVFTEKTTMRLEDIIKQRIKDKSWDDVVRKIKPVEDVREYRKKLVLDQEKSKLSLAEIYEQEYVKQRDAAKSSEEVKDDVEPVEHAEIKKIMRKLFTKLDALSNFHYTPKPVAPEIKIISNLPAITMEEVAPVATSDAALLAPEEVKNKRVGELMSKEERTATDKKRERRKKKLKQRLREKEKVKKEKLLSKMQLGLGNKYSKEKAKKMLDKLANEKNVDKVVETQAKHLKSSSAFFNKLEDDVRSQVKQKANSVAMKKVKLEKLNAKKIKL